MIGEIIQGAVSPPFTIMAGILLWRARSNAKSSTLFKQQNVHAAILKHQQTDTIKRERARHARERKRRRGGAERERERESEREREKERDRPAPPSLEP